VESRWCVYRVVYLEMKNSKERKKEKRKRNKEKRTENQRGDHHTKDNVQCSNNF
jgi:hypothetical protein